MGKIFFAFVLLCASSFAFAQTTVPCEIVIPVIDAKQQQVTAKGPNGQDYPVFREASENKLTAAVRQQLSSGFVQETLRLDRYARKMVAASGVKESWTHEPMMLLLSNTDGGFGRFGFWMEDAQGKRQFRPTGYVDLVVNESSLITGNFEEIFPHELAHLVLRAVARQIPNGPSRKMHQGMTITDYPTAFDEGYAEHFQPIARMNSTNPYVKKMLNGTGSTDFELFWLSNADTQLRTDGVRRNLFIHRKPAPEAAFDRNADLYQLFVLSETAANFLPTELKTAQQMMASEGVISTLFYRIVNDEQLRSHYREPAFYRQFLSQPTQNPEASLTPYENINLKLYAAMNKLADGDQSRPQMLRLIEQYGKLFPDEAKRIDSIFIETTWGATVSAQLSAQLEQAAIDGGRGDIEGLKKNRPFTQLDTTIEDAAKGKLALDANLGPELWIANSGFKIAQAVWSPERTEPLTINLNTATEVEFMTIPGIDFATARKIVVARHTRGYFATPDDLQGLVSGETLQKIKTMAEEMKTIKPMERQ